jgi:hypothetical protein
VGGGARENRGELVCGTGVETGFRDDLVTIATESMKRALKARRQSDWKSGIEDAAGGRGWQV